MIFLVTHCKLAHKDFIFHCSVVSNQEKRNGADENNAKEAT
jgi:hypothetical protein